MILSRLSPIFTIMSSAPVIQIDPTQYSLQTKKEDGKSYVRDIIRKKYVRFTPEEWVRQILIHYLINEKGVPQSLIAIEMDLEYNEMRKRPDITLFNREGSPILITECKAPTVSITQETFNQVARYNLVLQVNYLVVSNGEETYCCRMDYEENSYSFLEEVPDYDQLTRT